MSLREAGRTANQTIPSRSDRLRKKRSDISHQRAKKVVPPGTVTHPVRNSVSKSGAAARRISQRKAVAKRASQRISPNVLIRGTRQGVPLINRTQTNVRKKFAISLNNQGAEMLLPSLPFVRPGWRIFSGIILVCLGLMLLNISSSPDFRVTSVQTVGLERTNAADVNAVTRLHNIPIYAVDKKLVEENLLSAFPEFSDVSVKVGFPAVITIKAVEREPVIAWQYSGQVYWIDEEGVIFSPRGQEDTKNLLTLKSEQPPPPPPPPLEPPDDVPDSANLSEMLPTSTSIPTTRMDPDLLNAARRLSDLIPPGTVLVYSAYDGLGWYDSLGWNVFIGLELENLDAKMDIYQALVQQLDLKGIRPSMISVEHIHAPFYRLE